MNLSSHSSARTLFWVLLLIYSFARVLQVYPWRVSMTWIVILHVVPTALFALVHGARHYGVRGILTFFVICVLVGGAIENIGVLTGIPYGRYYFTGVMGPKVLFVPILLALAYVGMGYLSWGVARSIVGDGLVSLPVVASFVMVAWDVSMEPVWATVVHAWNWLDGGAYFGVPLSNFSGWFLTVYLIYQSFALFIRRTTHVAERKEYARQAILFFALSAAGNLLLLLPHRGPTVVTDPTGAQWRVASITAATALVSVFALGTFALMAWIRAGES